MGKFSTNNIRKIWINFFQKYKHTFIESKSLIPINDPSLLWINSGVATLKDYFTGVSTPPTPRLVNCQKSIRTNDIVNVGVTSRHHTIFEMLGNFSIGDYFKTEAISMGFEFITKELKLPIDKIYITVFVDDKISYDQWIKLGILKNHIIKNGRDRNFWDVGQGPCGPCSEIFYDRGIKYDPQKLNEKLFFDDIENDRYVEIWNIVFSEFNNDGKNNYQPLARKNIDTGAGLERLACILQDVPTNYDTDQFDLAINTLTKLSKTKYDPLAYFNDNLKQKELNRIIRVIIDHLKCNMFAIADGALPSNKERGAVLRKLFRRAMVLSIRLDLKINFIKELINALIIANCEFYPYLIKEKEHIITVLESEYQLFDITLKKGLDLFNKVILKKQNKISTEDVFKLVDTYGFPYDVIVEKCREHQIIIDEKQYLLLLEKHQKISRGNLEIKGMSQQAIGLINFTTPSEFLYDKVKIANAKIIGIFNQKFEPITTSNDPCWLAFDKTCFYATSGGQIHDEGIITIKQSRLKISDVIKSTNGQHLHLINEVNQTITINDHADLEINTIFRNNVCRNHTIEHILEMVLKTTIDDSIKQEGAFKCDQYFTFDFNLNRRLSDKELTLIEQQVNQLINKKHRVFTKLMTLEQANKASVIGHFDHVYKKINQKLRVVHIGDINKELCGGTHVKNTSEIEQFKIINYDHRSANSWRIRGITSNSTIDLYISDQIEEILTKVNDIKQKCQAYKIDDKKLFTAINSLNFTTTNDNLIKLTKKYQLIQQLANELFFAYEKAQAQIEINSIKETTTNNTSTSDFYYIIVNNCNIKAIINAISELINQNPHRCYLIINQTPTKLQYVLSSDHEQLKCNELIKEINQICQGSGGGNNKFAQGGSNHISTIDALLKYLKK